MEPRDLLADLFRTVGRRARGEDAPIAESTGLGGGMVGQIEEFITMPLDLATLLIDSGTEMAELVITTLAEAGYIVVKGATPL